MIQYRNKFVKNFDESDKNYIKAKNSNKFKVPIKIELKIDNWLKQKGVTEIYLKEEGVFNLKKIISDSRDTLCSIEKHTSSNLSLKSFDFTKNPLLKKRCNFLSCKKL